MTFARKEWICRRCGRLQILNLQSCPCGSRLFFAVAEGRRKYGRQEANGPSASRLPTGVSTLP
jgi:hypothetical protein